MDQREWDILQSVGVTERRPAVEKEREFISAWVEMGLSDELIRLAYERTVYQKKAMNWPYMNKILQSWHQAGYQTPAQVEAELQRLFDKQYRLTTREVTEIRTRTVTHTDPETGDTWEDEEEYEYQILYVTLRNKGTGTIAMGELTAEQKERYTAILSLKGNKPDLFGNDIYANESAGEDYDIPGEALADPEFAALSGRRRNTWDSLTSGAVPARRPALIAVASCAMSTPTAASTTCHAPRPRAFITSAPISQNPRPDRGTSSSLPAPTTRRGR